MKIQGKEKCTANLLHFNLVHSVAGIRLISRNLFDGLKTVGLP